MVATIYGHNIVALCTSTTHNRERHCWFLIRWKPQFVMHPHIIKCHYRKYSCAATEMTEEWMDKWMNMTSTEVALPTMYLSVYVNDCDLLLSV